MRLHRFSRGLSPEPGESVFPRAHGGGATAFTLVEMLAAMAVLMILGLLVVQIVVAVSRSVRLSNRQADAAGQARIAFGRIALDIASLVRRPDVDFSVGAGNGSSTLLFLSGVSSAASTGSPAGGAREASVVAYGVRPHPDNRGPGREGGGRPCLVRAGKALGWTQAGFMGLDATRLPVRLSEGFAPTESDYDILASGVIRFEVGFQLVADGRPVALADGIRIAASDGRIVYSPPVRNLLSVSGGTTAYVDVTRIAALVVGLVAVDAESLRLLDASQVSTVASRFPASGTGRLPLQDWSSVADGLAASGLDRALPLPALQGVRVFERFFPVAPTGTRIASSPLRAQSP